MTNQEIADNISDFNSANKTTWESNTNKYLLKINTAGPGYSGNIPDLISELNSKSLEDYNDIEKKVRDAGNLRLAAARTGNRKCPPC